MSRASLKALSRKPLTIDELFETLDAFVDMTAQAEALIGVSLIEDALKEAILTRFPVKLSNNDITSLFENEGPISSIGSRAALAFALGIIGEDTRADLHCLKDIRNAFAHARATLDYNNKELTDACKTLTAPRRMRAVRNVKAPTDPRKIFRGSIRLLWLHITQKGAGGQPVLDPP